MASSYTTNFGIEEMAAGDQTGTWGDTTNFNFDILDRIAAYKAVALSDASTATLTVREASPGTGTENLQDGMFRVIKFTGSLAQNCTVTIAPDTTTAWFIIENATTDTGSSGPYSLLMKQGSGAGASVTIQNGKNAIIYCDGAGSGAVVTDALADLQVGTLEVTGAGAIDGALTAGGGVAVTGNVTATGTVEPAGDTAADDAAAFGYTSVLGAIITGQGSTNDVTLVNDADATVLGIATGTTNVDVVGDITAANFQPDGDTAADDAAAFGYTSVLGAIITGQGSTNDVTLVNDADATVLGIPTGTTNVDIVGDLTAGTLNADGDTAADDAAAMGYTAAEGLILTGQGSTNDVTIKNDADADVIEIPTGGTDVTVAGKLTAGKILLGNTDTDTSTTGSVTLDYSANQNFVLTFTGNVTLDNPSTEAVGQAGVIVCIQDGSGSRTLSLGSQYKTVGDAGITLSTAANAVDIIPYFVSAADSILIGAVQLALSGA